MKITKKCNNSTQHKISIINKLRNKRSSSAGMFYTSSAGAVTSLILMCMLLSSLVAGIARVNVSAVTAEITVTTSGAQNVDVKPDATGATATSIGVDNINVSSTCRSGYNLAIFTSVDDNNLYLNGSSSNNQSNQYFSPADGTGTLINSPNTWGFLVSDTVPDSGSVFSAVPTLNNPLFIKTAAETARDTDIDDDINVYYGVAISSGLPAGNYKLIPNSGNNQDGTISYGFSMDPSCEDNTITLNAGNGISTLTASGWTGTGSASISKGFHEGETIDLSAITRGYKTGYTGAKYTVTGGTGTISGSTYTVGNNDGQITISATGLNTPVCTIQGGATKVYNRSATTLTATDNSTNFDTSSVNLTYSFGYASSGTADLDNWSTATTTNTYSVAKNAFRGTGRYYGVKVVATDKTDSTITSTCTSGTVDSASTGTTVANRTTMALVNSRVNFDATTNGGTLSGTSPVYVYYQGTATYSGRTNTTSRAIPTATPPTGKVFDGWYTAASGGSKVINADGTLTGVAVSGWTNASKQWVKTGTSDSTTATANQLYAQYVDPPLYMQDATKADCGKTMHDKRDTTNPTTYTTALIGGQCWMTTNLNLAGGTALSANDTNVASTYISSFTTSDNLTKNGDTIVLPASAKSFNGTNTANVYNSGKTGTDCNSPGCYSYYSWGAATLGSGKSVTRLNNDAPYSICPKGWHLPTTRDGEDNTSDVRKLMIALGGTSAIQSYNSSTSPTGQKLSNKLLSNYNFVNNGYYSGSSISNANSSSSLNTATAYNSGNMLGWSLGSTYVYTASSSSRSSGKAIRCVLDS